MRFDEAFLTRRWSNHLAWVDATWSDPHNFPYQVEQERTRTSTGRVERLTPNPILENGPLEPCERGELTYTVAIPMFVQGDVESDGDRWTRLLTTIRDEAFGRRRTESRKESKKRLVVLILANRFQTLDPSVNTSFWDVLDQLPRIEGITYQVLGTLWKVPRHRTIPWFPNLDSKKRAFRLLKITRPKIANRVYAADCAGARKQVPYQSLREGLKAHRRTTELLERLRLSGRTIYWCTMDADLAGLRVAGSSGLFTLYDGLIEKWRRDHDGALPTLLSTGYWAPIDERRYYQIAIEIDMKVREKMSRALPFAPYYPEPNFLLLLPEHATFRRIHYQSGPDEALESRRFIESARAIGAVAEDSLLFKAIPALQTALPSRFRTAKGESLEIDSKKALFHKGTLKALKGIRQTHLFRQQWGDQVTLAIPNRTGDLAYRSYGALCSSILRLFDVEALASIPDFGRHHPNTFERILRNHREWRLEMTALLDDHSLDREAAAHRMAKHFAAVCTGLNRRKLQPALLGFMEPAFTAQRELRDAGVSAEMIEKIGRAARWSGSAFANALIKWADRFDRGTAAA